MKHHVAVIAAISVLSGLSATADTVALWTFETPNWSTPSPNPTALTSPSINPSVGTGSARGFHASASTWTSVSGNGSNGSLSGNTWAIGDYLQFQLSTSGFFDLSVSYDQTSSNTGPRDYKFSYSTDGNVFTQFGATYGVLANASPNPTWNTTTPSGIYTVSFDLSAIDSLENRASIFFRIETTSNVSANGGAVATTGTSRVDNFLVSTVTPVPEPSTWALFGAGVIGLGLVIRRKAK